MRLDNSVAALECNNETRISVRRKCYWSPDFFSLLILNNINFCVID